VTDHGQKDDLTLLPGSDWSDEQPRLLAPSFLALLLEARTLASEKQALDPAAIASALLTTPTPIIATRSALPTNPSTTTTITTPTTH